MSILAASHEPQAGLGRTPNTESRRTPKVESRKPKVESRKPKAEARKPKPNWSRLTREGAGGGPCVLFVTDQPSYKQNERSSSSVQSAEEEAMSEFLLIYQGGDPTWVERYTPEQKKTVMEAWDEWFKQLECSS
jgi:hypothetical protein